MDRLDCDRMFVAVMETGSFARAARERGVSSGQASKLVSRLEDELGVQLMHRTTRALSPTEMGRAYFARIAPSWTISPPSTRRRGRLRRSRPAGSASRHP